MRIIPFTEVIEEEYINYIEEWEKANESIVPSASKRNNLSFNELKQQWLYHQTDAMFKEGFVPSTLYFLVYENNRILGVIHLRHELNDRLLQDGGHIGYGVRPSERGKGYAALMLELLLTKIRNEGYSKVLITCDDDNIASAKTIEKNNGILQDKVVFEGDLVRRYWIHL